MSSNNNEIGDIDSQIAKAAQTKLNRIAMSERGQDSDVAKLALQTFTNKQLMILVKQLAPLAGLKTSLFRATTQINAASHKGKKSFVKSMRGLIIDSMNIFRLSRGSKNLMIHGIVNGTVTDDKRKIDNKRLDDTITDEELKEIKKYNPSNYYYVLTLAQERVYANKKGKTLDFPMFDELLKHLSNHNAGDAFDNIENDRNIDKDTKKYFTHVLSNAKRESKLIVKLIDAQVNDCNFSNTPVSMYGYLTFFHLTKEEKEAAKTKEENEILYRKLWTRVVIYLHDYTDGDINELEKIVNLK